MNHYPHHIGDFNSATRHLTRVERSLYRDLIDLYYDTEKPLNGDFDKLARRIVCDEADKAALRDVLNEFFVLQDDGWHNQRCDAEIAKYQGQIEQASRAGRASAAKRLNANPTPVERPLDARCNSVDAALNQPEPEPEPEPITSKKNTSAVATPDGVTESVWEDFCQLRKSKKAKLTQTAVDGIQREASKAGWGLEAAIRECCARGWIGFKAEWVADKGRAETAYQRSMREKYEVVAPSIAARNPSTVVQNIDPNTYFAELAKAKTLEISHA